MQPFEKYRSLIERSTALIEKVSPCRVVLNKADACDKQQLMRVYGSLMWSVGNVLRTPEVCRVYIGSFRDGKYNPIGRDNKDLFDKERNDLLRDLR
eukprot:SAG31_NODE_252_length_19068_cov_18.307713_2_plen_96_part_00